MKIANNSSSLSIGEQFKDSRNQTWTLKSLNTVTATLSSETSGLKMIPIEDLHYQINNNLLNKIKSINTVVNPNLIINKVCSCSSLELFRYGCKCMAKV
jgi:hypothetical protein